MVRVAYLGPEASFSHQAALEAFPNINSSSFIPLPSFEAILSAIQNQPSHVTENDDAQVQYDYALLPVENSTNGGVVPVLDLLVQCGPQSQPPTYADIEIVGEHYLQVHHNLFCHKSVVDKAKSQDDIQNLNIKILYSHPQVWGQCGKFLTANFPLLDVERIHMSSTSAAAAFVAQNSQPEDNNDQQDSAKPPAAAAAVSATTTTTTQQPVVVPKASKVGNTAAICSSLAGEQNNLVNLAANIEDEPGRNTTRFFIIRNRNYPLSSSSFENSNHHHHLLHQHQQQHTTAITSGTSSVSSPSISWKSLITFTIPHTKPGSLAAALAVFSKHHFNLTAITTRPFREQLWHYVFFVECEQERTNEGDDAKVLRMVAELDNVTERRNLLGSWINRLQHDRY